MADTTTLLSVKYGTGMPASNSAADGALYFDTANHYLGVKLPDIALYKLNAELADDATSAITTLTGTTTAVGGLTVQNYDGSQTSNLIVPGIGLYATCASTDATAVKTATMANGVLPMDANNDPVLGTLVAIKFTAASNSSGVAPTKLVLESGSQATNAKDIKSSYSVAALTKNMLCANRTVIFYYDGTNWIALNELNRDTNTTYTLATKAEITSASTTTARLINGPRLLEGIQNALSTPANGQLKILGHALTSSGYTALADKTLTIYTHPSHTAYAANLYKVTVDALGHVTAATAVTTSDIEGYGFKTWTDIQDAGVANPATLAFSTAGNGDSGTTGSYNGSDGRTISYNSVGAAPASNIQLGAIDWGSGATGWTIPASLMPKEALLNLKIDSSTDTTPVNKTYSDVQVGDLIQMSSNSKLFYVAAMNSSNKVTSATEITVGTGVATTTAQSLSLALNSNTATTTFNGRTASFRLNCGFTSSKAADANQTESTASDNVAYLNLCLGAYSDLTTATKPYLQGIKLTGENSITVRTSNSNVITISHPKPFSAAQSNIGSTGGDLSVSSNKISFTIPRLTVSKEGHVTAIEGKTHNIGLTTYFSAGDKFATIAGVDIYGGVTWDTF